MLNECWNCKRRLTRGVSGPIVAWKLQMKGGEYSHTNVGQRSETGAGTQEAFSSGRRESHRNFQPIPQPIRERPNQEAVAVFPSQAREAVRHRLRVPHGGGWLRGAKRTDCGKSTNTCRRSAFQHQEIDTGRRTAVSAVPAILEVSI